MRTLVVFALIFVGLTSTASAESHTSDIHQSTTPPLDARYEVVQSQLAAKWTFRLDRYKGRISQLVRTQDEELTWETMVVQGLPHVYSYQTEICHFHFGNSLQTHIPHGL